MLPEKIKRLRTALGWSQERLAREVGVSFCTVNRWERGKSKPSPMAENVLKRMSEKAGDGNKRDTVRMDLRYPMGVRVLSQDNMMKGPGDHAPDRFNRGDFTSHTENISTGGLMFKAVSNIRQGDTVRINLDIGDKVPHVEAVSEVVWISEDNGGRRAGVRFKNVEPNGFTRLMNAMLMN
ncbi:MAG: PilZ domain-containing protein [Deltaproteobacteria bacterium]|nr:PilZ domain-containing protein [Deltaproteobacteria bacterium]